MAKKKKEPMTKVQKIRQKDMRLMIIILLIILTPLILMVLGIGAPGRAFM